MPPSADPSISTGDPSQAQAATNGDLDKPDGKGPDVKIPNIIEQLDMNYLEEASKLDTGNLSSIDPVDPVAMRKWLKDVYMKLPKAPQVKRIRPQVEVSAKNVPVSYGDQDNFRIRVYEPVENNAPGKLRPALLMLHGGGWIHGFPEVDEDLSKFFSSELRAVVIGVDYRLSPEFQFPIPGNDCFAALDWAVKNSEEYKIDTGRIGLWGCSAGANLAANVALRDSSENEVSRIRHVNLAVPITCHPSLYPPVLKSATASMSLFHGAKSAEEANIAVKRLWEAYAGSKFADPLVSVLLANPKSNHPPTHVTVAGCDMLRDEGIAYALQLRNAGVDTQLEVIPGVPHGVNISPTAIVAAQFFRNQVRTLDYGLNNSV